MLRGTEIWGGLAWLAFGLFVLLQGRDLGHGTINDPGAGFAFIWLGVIILGLAAVVILSSFRDAGPRLSSLWAETRWAKVLAVIAILLAFGYFFEDLGFVVCGSIMLLVLMTLIDPVGLSRALPIALIVPVAAWWVIAKGLKVQMPLGILSRWLG